jgi:hypothetical protein
MQGLSQLLTYAYSGLDGQRLSLLHRESAIALLQVLKAIGEEMIE